MDVFAVLEEYFMSSGVDGLRMGGALSLGGLSRILVLLREGVPAHRIVLTTFWRPFQAYLEYALRRHGVVQGLEGGRASADVLGVGRIWTFPSTRPSLRLCSDCMGKVA